MDHDAMTVLLACLGHAGDEVKAELARLSSEDWTAVAALSRRHGVTPLVYHRLKRLSIALPGELAERLKRAYLWNAARNVRLQQELSGLLRRLSEGSLPIIALKGAHLIESVYEDIGLRPVGDIDLLAREEDLLRIDKELRALGYKPAGPCTHHVRYAPPEGSYPIEIHWVLVGPELPIQVDVEGLWSRAQPLTRAPAMVLSPEDLLLHLCLHTALHVHDMRIRMLCDIGEVVRLHGEGLDWQEISARARQWGIVRAVYVVLQLASELLEVTVPENWLASLRPVRFDDRHLALLRQQISAPRMDGDTARALPAARLWGAKGLRGKMAVLRDSLLPSRDTIACMYLAPANSWRACLYYPVRWKDLLARHSAALWRLARGDAQTQATASRINALRDWLLSD
jgi:transposase-like protein